MQANHRLECKYKNCWNPNHLYIGTNAQNGRDVMLSRTQCKNGHDLHLNGKVIKRNNYDHSLRLICLKCREDNRRKDNDVSQFDPSTLFQVEATVNKKDEPIRGDD